MLTYTKELSTFIYMKMKNFSTKIIGVVFNYSLDRNTDPYTYVNSFVKK